MARITVEDCTDNVPNLFQLVLVAAKRARQLANGAEQLVPWENDKPTVVALREIAEGYVTESILEERDRTSMNCPMGSRPRPRCPGTCSFPDPSSRRLANDVIHRREDRELAWTIRPPSENICRQCGGRTGSANSWGSSRAISLNPNCPEYSTPMKPPPRLTTDSSGSAATTTSRTR